MDFIQNISEIWIQSDITDFSHSYQLHISVYAYIDRLRIDFKPNVRTDPKQKKTAVRLLFNCDLFIFVTEYLIHSSVTIWANQIRTALIYLIVHFKRNVLVPLPFQAWVYGSMSVCVI